MTTHDVIGIMFVIMICIQTYLWYRVRKDNTELHHKLNDANAVIDDYDRHATRQADVCQLIAIERDGRFVTFTYKRNDTVFTVECMSQLSDNVTLWREKAGLTNTPINQD